MVQLRSFPVRKRIRLPTYDYTSNGAYFVTFCTHEKRCMLGRVVGATMSCPSSCRGGYEPPVLPDTQIRVELTRLGTIVEEAISAIPAHYPTVSVSAHVIMPNHVHLLLVLHDENGEDGRLIAAPTVSTVVQQLKRYVSIAAGHAVWQRSFHDHVVRNEADYVDIWRYINENPARWAEDRYYQP